MAMEVTKYALHNANQTSSDVWVRDTSAEGTEKRGKLKRKDRRMLKWVFGL